jgi:soluble lytic murein transglycosylase-like protein
MTRVVYTVVSTALICSVAASFASVASAKDRPPDPIANPGECPIDLPVRVASLDSLRQFEGLIGHCPETALIESPARQANRPRTVREINAEDPSALQPWQIPSGPTLRETGAPVGPEPRTRKRDTPPAAPSTLTVASRDGKQIAIIPPQSSFHDAAWSSEAAPSTADATASPEVEAVLALRPRSYATAFDRSIAEAARTHKVDPLLLHAVIKQESGYRAAATSYAGARGIMQVMPDTGRGLGVRDPGLLYDPEVNINAGARLLSQLWQRFDGNIDLVLAAYNAGEGAVRKYGNSVPPYRETQDYVLKVKKNYRELAAESGLVVNF